MSKCQYIIKAANKKSAYSWKNNDRRCRNNAEINGFCTVHNNKIKRDKEK